MTFSTGVTIWLRSAGWRCVFAALLTLASLLAAGPPTADAVEVFVDRAADLGLDFTHFNGMSGELFFSEMMGSGVALVDYDLDGDLDLYFVQGNMLGDEVSVDDASVPPRHPLPLTDRLYRNDAVSVGSLPAPIRFVDRTDWSGVRAFGYGMGVAAGDIDNDGDLDLYLTNAGPNQMLLNRGDGTFADVSEQTGTADRRWGVSAAFVDFDKDGWLDLYVGNYVEYRLATDKECFSSTGRSDYCGPLAYRPEMDRLFRNRDGLDFEDVSVAAGILIDPPGNSLGVVSGDFNVDGWPDIYVANDQVPNKLWLNQGNGTFLNEAIFSGSAVNEAGQPEASMGVVVGDFNNDGVEDLFMSHLTMETNTLYLNDGSGLFIDASRDSGLAHASWAFTGFGIALFDYDLDGWSDLFIANGAVRQIEELRRQGDPYPLHQTNQLFHSRGGPRFEEVTAEMGSVFDLSEVSRGVAQGDVDGDGDVDLVVSNNAGPARLLLNEGNWGNSWLGVRLVAGDGRPTSFGSRVAVVGEDQTIWRRYNTDGSYASASDPRVVVGLGAQRDPVTVRVFWHSGGTTEFRGVPVGWTVHLYASGQ